MDVALLKSGDFRRRDVEVEAGHGHHLPYRLDHLARHGLRLRWTDRLYRPGWEGSPADRLIRRAEARTIPFAQAALMAPRVARAPITLAMFESEANLVTMARKAGLRTRSSSLAVVSCWLAEFLPRASPAKRAWYRWAYRAVDRLYYFSDNQTEILAEHLGLSPPQLRFVPFGVDAETFVVPDTGDGGYVLAVGRDQGRDWPTFFAAADRLGLPVKVCCRPRDIAGLRVPADVEVLGYVGRSQYRSLLGGARVVVVTTRDLAYPSGQSVLLEALAMGRAVVVSDTSALRSYVDDGVTALSVPVGDVAAVRERILEAVTDETLRARLGGAGRRRVEARFNAEAMWAEVAADLKSAADLKPAGTSGATMDLGAAGPR